MSEKDVEDSTIIPRVNPNKDFKQYLKTLNESGVEEYLRNHPKTDEAGPFGFASLKNANNDNDEEEEKKEAATGLEAVAETLRRSSLSRKSNASDLS